MRLIDADKLSRQRYPEYDETGTYIDVMCVRAEDIDNAPTVEASVPPVKAGQNVYETDGVRVYGHTVRDIVFDTGLIAFNETAIGKTVFLTREAAEDALKARGKDANE